MADKRLQIDFNMPQQHTPNSTENQAGFTGQAEENKETKKSNIGVPVKRTAMAFGVGKLATNTMQLNLYFEGNKVLQNQVERGVSAGKKLGAIGLTGFVSPTLAIAGIGSEVIDSFYTNQKRTEEIRRVNLDSTNQRELFNTNLNNGRYTGGQR